MANSGCKFARSSPMKEPRLQRVNCDSAMCYGLQLHAYLQATSFSSNTALQVLQLTTMLLAELVEAGEKCV